MGSGAASISQLFASIIIIGWISVLLYPGKWHYEDVSMFYRFDIGLHQVYVSEATGSQLVNGLFGAIGEATGVKIDTLKHAIERDVLGKHTVAEMRQTFCSLGNMAMAHELCNTWNYLLWSSWTAMAFIFLCIICLITACCLSYYFWNVKASEEGMAWTMSFYWLAFASAIIGVGQYGAATHNFHIVMFPSTFARQERNTFDFAFFVASALSFFTLVPALVAGSCADFEQHLQRVEAGALKGKQRRQDAQMPLVPPSDNMQTSGAAASGSGGMMMGGGGMMGGSGGMMGGSGGMMMGGGGGGTGYVQGPTVVMGGVGGMQGMPMTTGPAYVTTEQVTYSVQVGGGAPQIESYTGTYGGNMGPSGRGTDLHMPAQPT